MGVFAHRRVVADADKNPDPAGVFRVEGKRLHFADPDAVEANARTGRQSRHRAFEYDGIALATGTEIAHPKDEDESERQDAENESPDHEIVGFGFHQTGSLDLAITIRREFLAAHLAPPPVPVRHRNIP